MNIKRRIDRTAAALLLILPLLAGFILSTPGNLFSFDLEKQVKKVILDNGLTVLMLKRDTSPTVSFYIRHRVGAADEANGAAGAAHFLEHLMFKGTKTIGAKDYPAEKKMLHDIYRVGTLLDKEGMKGEAADKDRIEELKNELSRLQRRHQSMFSSNEIDRLYTENGAVRLNASTGQDITTYQVSLPTNKMELWARIEADRMVNPVFREFYEERDVIMEERRQSIESNPSGKLLEQFLAAAFHAHPYGRPILGWPSDMLYLNHDYVRSFFELYHAPNNTVIAIVGDIDYITTIRLIKKYFGHIKPQKIETTYITEEPVQKGERRIEVNIPANPQIIVGYHKPTMPSFDDYVFDMIESILSRGRTSRFYKSLIEEKGLAESVQAVNGLPAARYPNLFAVFATPRTPHDGMALEIELYKEIEKLKAEAVSQEEIEKTKNQLKADFIRSLASNSGLAGKLSYYEILTGDYRYLTNYINAIDKISPDDIMKAANKYLTKENRTVASIAKNSPAAQQRGEVIPGLEEAGDRKSD